jgi:hypothetical protein
LDNGEIELILDSKSEATEKNSEERDEVEDDMTEQAPVSLHQEVFK